MGAREVEAEKDEAGDLSLSGHSRRGAPTTGRGGKGNGEGRRVRRGPMVLAGTGRWCLQAAGMASAESAKAAAVIPVRRPRGSRRRSPPDLRLLAGSRGWPAVVVGDGG
uniref:DUF834 domain-containing protein n=1 Tax=Oryza rufipogon TaxID=4529 RepID=A0A0E0P0V2_ORYRU